MSLSDVLTQEHVLLRRFIGLLRWDEPEGGESPARLSGDLLAFFCALKRHEEFEDIAFAGEVAQLHADHRRLKKLDMRIIKLLEDARVGPSERLKPLVDSMAMRLRRHFAWEEKHFWPCYRLPGGSKAERSLEQRASASLKKLADEMETCGIRLSDSCGRGGFSAD